MTNLRPLTPRQEQIFDLIKENISETGMPPTRAEIADFFGFKSANAAEEHLKALAKKGYIEMLPGTSRGIRLAEEFIEVEGLMFIKNKCLVKKVLVVFYLLYPHVVLSFLPFVWSKKLISIKMHHVIRIFSNPHFCFPSYIRDVLPHLLLV